MSELAQWVFNTGSSFFQSLLTDWDILGFFIIAYFLIVRVVNFVKRFLK